MEIKKIEVFKFEELSKESKEKAIEDNSEINVYDDWYEFMIEDFKERLKQVGIECKDFNFNIYDKTISMNEPIVEDSKKLLNSFLICKQQILMGLENNKIKIEDDFELKSYEDGSIYFYFYDEIDKGEDKEEKLNQSEYREIINKKLEEMLIGFLSELEKEYYSAMSDESIAETLEINEYDFLEGGKRF